MLNERKLTERELDHREVVLKNLLKNKSNLVKKYGKDAEKVMYGIATKKAKKKIEQMNLDTIKELVRAQLEASPTSTTTDIDANKSYSGGADYGSEVSANSDENSIEQGETQPLHYSLEEGHGLDQGDIDVLKNLITQLKDGGDLRLDVAGRKSFIRVLNFIIKSNILQDKTKDLSKGKVDENIIKEFLQGDLKDRNQVLFDKLVPNSGASKFAEGEMIRALNRLIYRFYNDGDKFFEGYGTETAGPAHSFLVNSDQINRGEQRKFEALFDSVVGTYDDNEYEKMLLKLANLVMSYVEGIPEDQYQELGREMFDFEPEYEEEDYDEEDDFYDEYDEEEEDYYMQEGKLNESPSSEEIRMARQAVYRFMKYRQVEADEAIRDLINALEVLKRTGVKGRLSEEKEDISKILKAQKIIKKVLKDEGGAAGLKPIVAALKGLKIGKDELIKILKKTVGVVKHQHGDYIIKPIEEITLSEKIDALVREKLTKKSKVKEARDLDLLSDFKPGGKYYLPNDGYMAAKLRNEDGYYTLPGPYNEKEEGEEEENKRKNAEYRKEKAEHTIKMEMGIKDPEVIKKFIDSWMKYSQEQLEEKLTKKHDVGDFVDDFQKSDAKQFKGKSDKKKKEMAVAAYLAKQNEK